MDLSSRFTFSDELKSFLLPQLEELCSEMNELVKCAETMTKAASVPLPSENAITVVTPSAAASTEISIASMESTPSSLVFPQVAMHMDANVLAVPSSRAIVPAWCSTKCEEVAVHADENVVANTVMSEVPTECSSLVPDQSLGVAVSPVVGTDPSEFNVGALTTCSTKCSGIVEAVKACACVLHTRTASTTSPTRMLHDGLALSLMLSRLMSLVHGNMDVYQVFDEMLQSNAAISSYTINMLAAEIVSTTALELTLTTPLQMLEDHASTNSKEHQLDLCTEQVQRT